MAKIVGYEVHPAAEIMPLIDGEAYEKFKENIAEHGVQADVELLGGKIIDGRNRARACKDLGIDFDVVEISLPEGQTPEDYVWTMNAVRRQLDKGQLAVSAAAYANRLKSSGDAETATEAVSRAAEQVGVSPRAVQQAQELIKKAPKVAARVASGEVSTIRGGLREAGLANGSKPQKSGRPRMGKGNRMECYKSVSRLINVLNKHGVYDSAAKSHCDALAKMFDPKGR